MKTILSLFVILTTLFFIGCGGDDTKKDVNCTATSCKGWEVCADSGKCEKDATKCEKDADCKDGDKTKCDATTFTCFKPCTLDEKRCSDKNVEICKDTGLWEVSETCTAPKVCKAGDFICEEPSTCIGMSFDTINHDIAGYPNTYEGKSGNYLLSVGFYPADDADIISSGTYDLASVGKNDNYKTCIECVLAYEYNEAGDKILKTFFQTKGTLVVDKTLNAAKGESLGEVKEIKLVEATINETTFESTPVTDGECIEIQTGSEWKWDTTCEAGTVRCSADGKLIEVCADKMWGQQTSCEALSGVCITKDDDAKTPECFVCADHDTDGVGSTVDMAKNTTSPQAESDGYVCKDANDWYLVTLAANETIIVDVNFDKEKGNISTSLFYGMPGTDAKPLVKSEAIETGVSLAYTSTEAGDYYLLVDGSRLKTGNSYKLTIKNSCTTNKECLTGNFCNASSKCEKLPNCKDDTVCDTLTSINATANYGCNLPTNYQTTCKELKAHTCGGESTNDKFSTAEMIEVGVQKAAETCVEDADWYKFVLTEATTDIKVDLIFPEGDLDFSLHGPDNGMDSLAFGVKEQPYANLGGEGKIEIEACTPEGDECVNNTNGRTACANLKCIGQEKAEVKMLPAGTYYLKVIRYRMTINEDTGEEEPTDVTSTYTLDIIKTANTDCTTETCAQIFPLRSVCTADKACTNIDAEDYSVVTGGFCENKLDCNEAEGLMYNCMDFGKGTPNYDNFCTIGCSADADCTATGVENLGWCATVDMYWGIIPIKACLKTCTNMDANYCKNIMGDIAATCNAGKCTTPAE